MGRQISKHRRRLAEEEGETVREDYVQKMRDTYPLIIRTLMHDLIVSIDKDGDLVFLNDAAVEFWGTSSEEIVGTHFFDYLYPEDVKKTQVALQEIIKSKGQVKGLIVRVKSPSGARKVAWNAVAIFDEAGNYVGIQATGKDLTDLLRTEEELKWSQRHFQRLFEVLVDPVVIVDVKGNILELSQSAEEILGFPREELVGKHLMETNVVTDKSKAIMMKNLEKMKKGEYISPYTIEAVTKDGKKLLYESTPAKLMYKGEPAILGIFHNITEQMRAEEKLRASEERFKYFLENAPEAIWVQDIVGTFLDGNKRAEELTGYNKEELIGKNMLEMNLVPPEYIPMAIEAFKANKPGEISGPNELELIRKDGSLVSIEASTIPVERNGKIEIIGIGRDITDRKKTEDALKESEKRFRELSELLPEIVFETDATGKLTFLNKAALDHTGYSQEDFDKGLSAFQMIVPEDRDRAERNVGKVLGGKEVGPNEYIALRKDGSTFPIIIHSTPIIRGNKPVGLRGVIVDITEQKLAEEKVRQSEERYRTVFENTGTAMCILEEDKTISMVNRRFEELSGYSWKELKGKKWTEFVTREYLERMERYHEARRNKGGKAPKHYSFDFVNKKGQIRNVLLTIELIPGTKKSVASILDITERKLAEKELIRLSNAVRVSTDSIVITDLNGTVLDVNEATMKLYGSDDKSNLIGTNAFNLVAPEEREKALAGLKEVLEKGQIPSREYTVVAKDGSQIPVEMSTAIMKDADGKPMGFVSISRDITERKKAEDALKESEKRFRELSELLPEIVFETDVTGVLTFVNKAAIDHTGYSREDFDRGLNALRMVVPEDRDNAKKTIGELLSGKNIGPVEYTALRKDGSTFPIIIHSNPITRENRVVGMRGIIVDITERKKTENVIKESEERFRTIFEGATDGILAADPKTFKFAFTNPRMHEIAGYPGGELINLTIADLVRKEDVPFAIDQFKKQLEKKVTLTRNVPILRKDKTIVYCDISSKLMEIGEKQYLIGFFRDVTEQKKAEEALLRSEKEARHLLEFQNKVIDTATVWVNLVDLKGNVILWNRAAELISGYSRKEIIGHRKMWKWLYPDSDYRAKIFSVGKEIIDERKHLEDSESTIRCKDGSIKTISWYATTVLDEKGNPAGSIAIGIDITERKRAEKELIRLSSAVRISNDSIVISDLDGTVLDVNEATLKIYGSDDKSNLIGTNAFNLVAPKEREKALASMKELLEKGYIPNREYTVIAKDGSEIPVEMSTAIMKDADGKPMGFVAISRDITERKKAEEALKESETKYRSIINAMNDTVWVIGFDGKFVDMNDAAVEVLGYTRQELLSMGPKDLSINMPEEEVKALIDNMPKDEIQVFEATHFTKDGRQIPVEISSSLVTYKGKQAILSIARDITERKRAQEAIREANGLLKQSNSELESYTYVVSHDLKAPLRTIRSFGSFLLEDYGDRLDETGKDYLNRMVNASSHLDSMIEDLLVLSRVGRKFTEIEKVNLNDLLREILTDLEAAIKERNAEVVVDKLPVLSAQKVWIRQLFMNLISNALKFNESKTPKIEILYEERENEPLFKVRDNGIGIEKKYLERIFNLFERAPTEKKYEGTGAGLAICKKIVEQLGGEMWVESTPGKGSTFMFTISKEIKQEKEA